MIVGRRVAQPTRKHVEAKRVFNTAQQQRLSEQQRQIVQIELKRYAHRHHIKHADQWYNVGRTDLERASADPQFKRILREYGICMLLQSLYPEHSWQVWKFKKVPTGWWKDVANQRAFLQNYAHEHNFTSLEDWYGVDVRTFKKNHGAYLLRLYGGSLRRALETAFPEHEWHAWKFSHTPGNLLRDPNYMRSFFDSIAKKMGITDLNQWYKITVNDISKLTEKLSASYPEHQWLPWRFKSTPSKWWLDATNQMKFINYFAKINNINDMEDWYSVTLKEIAEAGGSKLLKQYRTLYNLLCTIYPEHKWDASRFSHVPRGWWVNQQHQREFLENYARSNNIIDLNDWYKVRTKDLSAVAGGRSLLTYFGGSLRKALQSAFPEHQWHRWKFHGLPRSFWRNPLNVREVFDHLAKKLKIETLEQWYQVTFEVIVREIGHRFFSKEVFGGSLQKALEFAYPEHNWVSWKFPRVTGNYWLDVENVRSFLSEVGDELGIQTLEGWYNCDKETLEQHSGPMLFQVYAGSLYEILKTAYPSHPWDPMKFLSQKEYKPSIRENFDRIALELEITNTDGWYSLTQSQLRIVKARAASIIRRNGSLIRALALAYPEHTFHPWRFQFIEMPKSFWLKTMKDDTALREFIQDLRTKLNIDEDNLEAWYSVTAASLDPPIRRIINKIGGLQTLLKLAYPEHSWDPTKFASHTSPKRRVQHSILVSIGKILTPQQENDYREQQGT